MTLNVDGQHSLIKESIAQLSADNMTAHSLLGLQECFTGSNRCISRYRYCTSNEIKTKVYFSSLSKFMVVTGLKLLCNSCKLFPI